MARYSEQSRRPGELTAPEAARQLGVCATTICRWCRAALAGDPSHVPADAVRVDIAGRYWVAARAVVRIQARELMLSEPSE